MPIRTAHREIGPLEWSARVYAFIKRLDDIFDEYQYDRASINDKIPKSVQEIMQGKGPCPFLKELLGEDIKTLGWLGGALAQDQYASGGQSEEECTESMWKLFNAAVYLVNRMAIVGEEISRLNIIPVIDDISESNVRKIEEFASLNMQCSYLAGCICRPYPHSSDSFATMGKAYVPIGEIANQIPVLLRDDFLPNSKARVTTLAAKYQKTQPVLDGKLNDTLHDPGYKQILTDASDMFCDLDAERRAKRVSPNVVLAYLRTMTYADLAARLKQHAADFGPRIDDIIEDIPRYEGSGKSADTAKLVIAMKNELAQLRKSQESFNLAADWLHTLGNQRIDMHKIYSEVRLALGESNLITAKDLKERSPLGYAIYYDVLTQYIDRKERAATVEDDTVVKITLEGKKQDRENSIKSADAALDGTDKSLYNLINALANLGKPVPQLDPSQIVSEAHKLVSSLGLAP